MKPQNIVLITIDSLRHDQISGFRGSQNPAPTLTHLTDKAAVFDQAIANGPNTPSSFPSILTGTHAMMYGGYDYLNENRPFLSTCVKDAGYTTVGFHSNPHLGPERNYNAGFDFFNIGAEETNSKDRLIDFVDNNIDNSSKLYTILRGLWHIVGSATGASAYKRAETITNNAVEWIEKTDTEQFFMWTHYMDVHYPFQPPNEHIEAVGQEPLSPRRVASLNDAMHEHPESLTEEDIKDLKTLYAGELHYVDYNLSRILDALSAKGIRDKTMIIITADHGEAFGEHDRWGHHPYMYDELLRVPLLVDVPRVEAKKIETQVSLIDIFPTICDVCGIDQPTELQGENLFKKENEVELATSSDGKRLAARTIEWKCLWHVAENEFELYNLSEDPKETVDVSSKHPNVVERLKNEMEKYRDAADATDAELPDIEDSEKTKQRLADLGYVD
jgi:arylsulfatase A-like enzyme